MTKMTLTPYTVGREGGHDNLGMKEWSDWPYILF